MFTSIHLSYLSLLLCARERKAIKLENWIISPPKNSCLWAKLSDDPGVGLVSNVRQFRCWWTRARCAACWQISSSSQKGEKTKLTEKTHGKPVKERKKVSENNKNITRERFQRVVKMDGWCVGFALLLWWRNVKEHRVVIMEIKERKNTKCVRLLVEWKAGTATTTAVCCGMKQSRGNETGKATYKMPKVHWLYFRFNITIFIYFSCSLHSVVVSLIVPKS